MDDQVTIHCTVDGHRVVRQVDADEVLLHALREKFQVTAPKWGCGTGDCGACTVILDGQAVDSCLVYAAECEGAEITTASGVAETAIGQVILRELGEVGAVQCGICTPGVVVAIAANLSGLGANPSHEQISELLSGNVCRCTGYIPFFDAVQRIAKRFEGDGGLAQ